MVLDVSGVQISSGTIYSITEAGLQGHIEVAITVIEL